MANTPVYAFPYPGVGDSPHGPNQIEALAESVETQLVRIDGSAVVAVTSLGSVTAPFTGQVAFNTTDGCAYKWSGSAWVLFHPGEMWIYKTATESVTNSTTMQNDDAFAFGVAVNSAYAVESFLPYDGAADPAGGLKMGFTGPTGASLYFANFGANGTGSPGGTLTDQNVVVEGFAAGSPRGVGTNAGTIMSCTPTGVVVVGGTAGTVQFQWAQRTANATATRILSAAWMKLTKIA
jgi:hypothetical protein